MEIGLLWYDDDPRKPLERKVAEAAERYQQRFGAVPDVCHVHRPSPPPPAGEADGDSPRQSLALSLTCAGRPIRAAVTVVPDRVVRPNYFWIGKERAV